MEITPSQPLKPEVIEIMMSEEQVMAQFEAYES